MIEFIMSIIMFLSSLLGGNIEGRSAQADVLVMPETPVEIVMDVQPETQTQHQTNDTTQNEIVIEGDVVWGNTLPMWGTMCEETPVYGNPNGLGDPIDTLYVGEVVRLHELSQGVVGWIMVERAAYWIPLSTICEW